MHYQGLWVEKALENKGYRGVGDLYSDMRWMRPPWQWTRLQALRSLRDHFQGKVKKQKKQVEIFRQQAGLFGTDDLSSIIKRGNRTYWQKTEWKTCFFFYHSVL
jgi:hypothetical protein